MALRSMITDWRSVAGWTADQRARTPDYWSLGNTSLATDIATLPGKKLVQFQPGVMMGGDGLPAGVYADDLYTAMHGAGALTATSLTVSPDPPVMIFDLTKRGVPKLVADVILSHFGSAAQGTHFDYWCNLWWLFGNGWTPTGESPTTYWPKWSVALAQVAGILRAARPDWLVVGQNFQLDGEGAMNAQINGLFLEQYPTAFRYTLAGHVEDKAALMNLWSMAKWQRESIWVVELRNPETFDPTYLAFLLDWCEKNDFVVSFGRGAAASVPS